MKKVYVSVLLLLLAFSASAQLSGTYTVNSALPTKKSNFKTLSEALDALKYEQLESDVVFELSPGFYNQPLVFEGLQNELDFTVTFTNNSDEMVEFVNDGLSLIISNSKNIEISNIKFSAISTEMANMVLLSNSNNVAINNNEFMVAEMEASHKSIVAITRSSHNNVLFNNTLRGANGVKVDRLSNNNSILSNDVYFTSAGAQILTALNSQVISNYFQGMGNGQKKGIVVDGVVGEMTIASNAILGVDEGISQETTFRPSDNKFSGSIVNNVVEAESHALSFTNNVNSLQIAFNSFISKNGSALFFKDQFKSSIENVNIFANNLVNEGDNPIINVSSDEVIGTVDYNNLYNQDGIFRNLVGSAKITNIEAWKTIMNAENAISADPQFVANGELKYSLSEKSPCIDAGPDAYVIGVFTDYDGDRRGKVTEIGADEFNKLAFEEIMQQYQLAFK